MSRPDRQAVSAACYPAVLCTSTIRKQARFNGVSFTQPWPPLHRKCVQSLWGCQSAAPQSAKGSAQPSVQLSVCLSNTWCLRIQTTDLLKFLTLTHVWEVFGWVDLGSPSGFPCKQRNTFYCVAGPQFKNLLQQFLHFWNIQVQTENNYWLKWISICFNVWWSHLDEWWRKAEFKSNSSLKLCHLDEREPSLAICSNKF